MTNEQALALPPGTRVLGPYHSQKRLGTFIAAKRMPPTSTWRVVRVTVKWDHCVAPSHTGAHRVELADE